MQEDDDCLALILPAVRRGDLWNARRRALASCFMAPLGTANPSFLLGAAPPAPSPRAFNDRCSRRCAEAWGVATAELFAQPDYLHLIHRTHSRHFRRLGGAEHLWSARLAECFADSRGHHGIRADGWESCCSSLRDLGDTDGCGAEGRSRAIECCAFGNTSRSFLRIPAIREGFVQVRLPTGRLMRVEQDGWLRPFDMPTVMWPAGFLLAQWASGACAQLQGGAGAVLELGAGAGAASVACALSSGVAHVIATDIETRSLALSTANAALNGATAFETTRFDWHDDAELARMVAAGPYAIIMGASLQYEAWTARLWALLGALASEETLVALVHTTGALKLDEAPARAAFREVERIGGAALGMGVGPADDVFSEFEVVLLRSRAVS